METKELKQKWVEAKKELSTDKEKEISEFIRKNAWSISPMSFFFVSLQIKAKGWEGIPYRDYKTFNGWKAEGLRVKKGEHSQIHGVTWIKAQVKNESGDIVDSEDGPVFPKGYHLFGRHQVA